MFKKIKLVIQNSGNIVKNKLIGSDLYRKQYKRTTLFIKRKPMTAFFAALLLLLIVIIAGSIVNRTKPQKPTPALVKNIHTYNIGESPKITAQAKIEKTGVIKIVALSGGVVQDINVKEGDIVQKGTQILLLSTNYQGGNSPAIQAQIADAQYQNVLDTFQKQEDLIGNQKDIAEKTDQNAQQMRVIQQQSVDETNNLISANQGVLDTLRQGPQLNDPATQLQTQQQINQLQGAQNQLRESARNTIFQSSDTNLPAELADLQRDATLKQLDLQEKTLQLSKDVSQLQAEVAEVNAATMFPASPFSGTVERVYVRVGQQVTPGTQLAEISSNNHASTAVVSVPGNIARNISTLVASTIYFGNNAYDVRPTFISSDATDGLLYTVTYAVPDDVNINVTDGDYVKVAIPVGSSNTSAAAPSVPLDAIYQTQDKNYLLVINNKKAVTREVTLGNVFGSYVEITQGLKSGDQVIVDRNVIAGDTVQAN